MALLARCVGGYSSRVVVPESALARIPDTLSFEQAAALPLVALTAWQVGLNSAADCCAAYLLLPFACGSTFPFCAQCNRLCGPEACAASVAATHLLRRDWIWHMCRQATVC